jgi:nitrate reductase NapE component
VDERPREDLEELLDEESLAVLAILLAVALEFGFGFGNYVVWWAGIVAGPASMAILVGLFRWAPTRARLVAAARWVLGRPAAQPRR